MLLKVQVLLAIDIACSLIAALYKSGTTAGSYKLVHKLRQSVSDKHHNYIIGS